MKTEICRFVSLVLALAVGCALEELLPTVGGVGIPVLLLTSVVVAARRGPFGALLFAYAAGAAEDALSGLPPATSAVFFVAAAAASRALAVPRLLFVPIVAAYPVWLSIWVPSLVTGVFVRILVSIPLSLAVGFAIEAILRRLERGFSDVPA